MGKLKTVKQIKDCQCLLSHVAKLLFDEFWKWKWSVRNVSDVIVDCLGFRGDCKYCFTAATVVKGRLPAEFTGLRNLRFSRVEPCATSDAPPPHHPSPQFLFTSRHRLRGNSVCMVYCSVWLTQRSNSVCCGNENPTGGAGVMRPNHVLCLSSDTHVVVWTALLRVTFTATVLELMIGWRRFGYAHQTSEWRMVTIEHRLKWRLSVLIVLS